MTSERNPPVEVLEVLLGERRVGALTHLPGENTLFTFDDDYRDDPRRPTLSLSFNAPLGELVTRARPTHVKVPPFFSNLLPEGHLRQYLAERGDIHPEREFFLLWLLGQDLPGAVVVRPVDGAALPPGAIDATSGIDADPGLLRFSLAGVQLKFSAIQEATGGLTIPATGTGGSWIVKLPSATYPAVPENEYVMMELARAVGIAVPDVRLTPIETIAGLPLEPPAALGNALAIRRFDRDADGTRIHIEDFAQVFSIFPRAKYEHASYQSIARVLWAEVGELGIAELSRRLAFTALIGNADMHLKNWSLRYPDGRTPELAPAYDFVATIPYLADREMALSLAGTRLFTDVSVHRFRRFAARASIPEALVVDSALETVVRLRQAWRTHEVVGLLPEPIRHAVERHMETIPLAREV